MRTPTYDFETTLHSTDDVLNEAFFISQLYLHDTDRMERMLGDLAQLLSALEVLGERQGMPSPWQMILFTLFQIHGFGPDRRAEMRHAIKTFNGTRCLPPPVPVSNDSGKH